MNVLSQKSQVYAATCEAARQSVLAHFKPIPGSKLGELAANFDIVLGVTAQETETGKLQGGISKPQFNRRR